VLTAYSKLVDNLGQEMRTQLVDGLLADLLQDVGLLRVHTHSITYNIIATLCVINLVTLLLYHDCIRLVRTTLCCNKSDNAIKLVTTTGNKQCEHSSRQLVNRFVTTCLQTCNNLCFFTCYKSVHKLSTSCVRTACSQLCKFDSIIRPVTRLF
jgi:hypothetical protein